MNIKEITDIGEQLQERRKGISFSGPSDGMSYLVFPGDKVTVLLNQDISPIPFDLSHVTEEGNHVRFYVEHVANDMNFATCSTNNKVCFAKKYVQTCSHPSHP